jgi:hypothetical protein
MVRSAAAAAAAAAAGAAFAARLTAVPAPAHRAGWIQSATLYDRGLSVDELKAMTREKGRLR